MYPPVHWIGVAHRVVSRGTGSVDWRWWKKRYPRTFSAGNRRWLNERWKRQITLEGWGIRNSRSTWEVVLHWKVFLSASAGARGRWRDWRATRVTTHLIFLRGIVTSRLVLTSGLSPVILRNALRNVDTLVGDERRYYGLFLSQKERVFLADNARLN